MNYDDELEDGERAKGKGQDKGLSPEGAKVK
jgi:hypothetical protein